VEWLKVKALSSSLSTEKKKKKKRREQAGHGWFMPVVHTGGSILATWEAEIRRIVV
jgi:hypothetical protein